MRRAMQNKVSYNKYPYIFNKRDNEILSFFVVWKINVKNISIASQAINPNSPVLVVILQHLYKLVAYLQNLPYLGYSSENLPHLPPLIIMA